MSRFSYFLFVISLLILLQIPSHASSENYQIPGQSNGIVYYVHRDFNVKISAQGLSNSSISIVINGQVYPLPLGGSIILDNISGHVLIWSSSGNYLLHVVIFPSVYQYYFYGGAFITCSGASISLIILARLRNNI